MNRATSRLVSAAASFAFLFLCGCGSPTDRRPLHGCVRIDGGAVTHGSISFLPAQGSSGPAANTAIVDGEYRFSDESGPYSGPHRVLIDIDVEPAADDEAGAETTEDVKAVDVKAARARAARSRPPRPIADRTTERLTKRHWELEYVVPEDGENRRDFDLSQ